MVAPVELSVLLRKHSFTYGAAVELEGGEFHLSSNPGDGPVITNLDRIRFSRFNIGPTVAWHFADHLRLQVSGGIALKRTLKTITQSGTENDLDLESGIFIKSGIYLGQ